ncbi:MAG: helix-turn-helix transcriptional regulator [Phycisphaerales bacterium]|nr:helix-turn-helix transcriptional regulator [Hyphomonadaceae bacterium]
MRTRAPSAATVKLLAALLQQPQAYRYGYELMKTTGLESGTLYPILARLLERNFLQAEWRPAREEGRPPRHAYRLTNTGAAYAAEHAAPKSRARPTKQKTRPA